MKHISKYLLLSTALLLVSACSSFHDERDDTNDSPNYTVPYLA